MALQAAQRLADKLRAPKATVSFIGLLCRFIATQPAESRPRNACTSGPQLE